MPISLTVPGLKWRHHNNKTIAFWIRTDGARKVGYPVRSVRLWSGPVGTKPTDEEMAAIRRKCYRLQGEMKEWFKNPLAKKGVITRRSGYVYFWRANDLIKIGFAVVPEKRLRNLQGASPAIGECLGLLQGNREVEKYIHWLFRSSRQHGEWFSITPDLITFISMHGQDAEQAPREQTVAKLRERIWNGSKRDFFSKQNHRLA